MHINYDILNSSGYKFKTCQKYPMLGIFFMDFTS